MFSVSALCSENKTRYSLTAPYTTESSNDTDKNATAPHGTLPILYGFGWALISIHPALTSFIGWSIKARDDNISLGLS
ncbi:MAG TPA: hypothetical protein VIU12_06125 [Chryseolinea sp.]